MKRRNLLQGALAAPFATAALGRGAAAQDTAPLFSLAFVTDTHIQPELNAAQACRQCFAQIAREPYDFVIHGGDHVFDAMEANEARATALMDLYAEVEKGIGHTVHHVLGNHDCLGLFAKSGVTPGAPHYGKRFFTERFGPTHYSFDHKGIRFVVLDSIGITPDRNYEGRVDAAQLDWLKAELAGLAKDQPVILVTHIPLVTALSCYEPLDWLETPHNWTSITNGREVLRLLRGHKVLAVLQGHGHVDEHILLNGTPFISGGSVAGADWEGRFLGTDHGYLHVDVHADRVETRYRTFGFTGVGKGDVDIGVTAPGTARG